MGSSELLPPHFALPTHPGRSLRAPHAVLLPGLVSDLPASLCWCHFLLSTATASPGAMTRARNTICSHRLRTCNGKCFSMLQLSKRRSSWQDVEMEDNSVRKETGQRGREKPIKDNQTSAKETDSSPTGEPYTAACRKDERVGKPQGLGVPLLSSPCVWQGTCQRCCLCTAGAWSLLPTPMCPKPGVEPGHT